MTSFSDHSDEVQRLNAAADQGDVTTVAALLAHTTAHQRAVALNRASRHDQPAVIALLLPTDLGVYGHHAVASAVKSAAEAGSLQALDGLLTAHPQLLLAGLEGALLRDPPHMASLAWLGPRATTPHWEALVDDLLDNEDSHGLDHDACLARLEVLLPWMTPAYQRHLLDTHGVALLPQTQARVQAHDRATAAQHTPPTAASTARRRRRS